MTEKTPKSPSNMKNMQDKFKSFIGTKKAKKEAVKHDHSALYQNSDEFLEAIKQKIDVQQAIYYCEAIHVLPTKSIEDEYVVVIMRITSEELRGFFGGNYLIQQWAKKQKIFQAVHTNRPNKFFLNQQRFIYSLQGTDAECSNLYVVNFYQNIFQKVKHPFYSPDNLDGIHDISVYVDPKQVLVVNGEEILWASLKIESLVTAGNKESLDHSSLSNPSLLNLKSDTFDGFEQEITTSTVETKADFKNVLQQSVSEDKPDNIIRVHCVCSEGFMRKEVHFAVETDEKIYILSVDAQKRGSFQVFVIAQVFSFEKQFIDIGIADPIDYITLENYADQENLIVIQMESKELKVFSQTIEQRMNEYAASVKAQMEEESDSSDEEEKARIAAIVAQRNKFCYKVTHACRRDEPLPVYQKKKKEEKPVILKNAALSKIKNFVNNVKAKMYLKVHSYFMRRQFIYFVGEDGKEIRRFNINNIQNQDCTTKAQKVNYSLEVSVLQDVVFHVSIFNDFLMANTTLIISHSKILSILDFLTNQWRHMLPYEQGNVRQELGQTYFGQPDDEIDQLMLNYIFSNSIYDCIIKYKGKFIKRLKYYNDLDKQYFEKGEIFKNQKVLQVQRNQDNRNYRQYGDSTTRMLFLIEDPNLGIQQIWVSENGSRITKFIDNIPLEEQWKLVEIPNARSDMLIIYSGKQRSLSIYNIPNSKQCLYPSQLLKYRINEITHMDYDINQKIQYFLFFDKLYFARNGNLAYINTNGKGNEFNEISFNGNIKDIFMTHHDGVYYKDKNNIFRFAHLTIQKQFNVDKIPTEIVNCRGAFCTRIEYSITTNRIALFTSSFEISIFPLLDRCRLDMMASQDFEQNFMCWKQIDNHLIALKKPNILVTWDTDTGKILQYSKLDGYNFGEFKRHTEWNGCTLMKQIKEAKTQENQTEGNEEQDEKDSFDPPYEENLTEEEKQKLEMESKHLYSLIEIISPTEIKEHCQFHYDFTPGTYLYVSFPYLLVMDEFCTKQYLIEGKGILKTMRQLNTFYEPQMKLGKPIYFSQNFYHRLYIDQQSKDIVINFTLTNTNIYTLNIRKQLMFQIEKTHPMIYFHDNDKLVYLTIYGVEKVFKIKKILGNRIRKGTCELKEISNIYYNESAFIRRYILDPLSYNSQLASQMDKLNILKFRGDILKRNLILNVYTNSRTEKKKKSLPRFFEDKNISAFRNFVINNYRQELTFNFFMWRMVENLSKKKVFLRDLDTNFLTEMSFIILPDNRNILHLLSENYEVLDEFIRYVNNENLEQEHQKSVNISDILFIPDLKGKTPIHYSIKTNNTRVTDRLVKALTFTDFDHHNRFIIDRYSKLIELVPQTMSVYLSARLKCPSWISTYTRGRIEPLNDGDFVMTADEIWKQDFDKSIQDKLYEPKALEVPLEMYILDMPHLHKYENDHADNFLEALANTDQIEIFSNNAIKALIELKWPLVKAAIKKFLFYPYLTFLMSFLFYTVYIFEEFNKVTVAEVMAADTVANSTMASGEAVTLAELDVPSIDQLKDPNFWLKQQQIMIKIVIIIFCMYFLSLELRQMFIQGIFKYLGSPWNYLDLIPLFLISFSMFFQAYGIDPQYERPLNAIACFFMWIKFLYFWRIFRQTSKFISMIVAIIVDLKEFLVVFLVTLIAFGQAMYIMSNNNKTPGELKEEYGDDEDQIATQARFIYSIPDAIFFAYRMSLGDFDTSQLGTVYKILVIMMFILSTLFLTIMMLNILIAVISDSYARVESTSVEEMYKNFADLMTENEYLVKKKHLKSHDDMGDYLYIAKVDKTEGEDEVQQKLNEIKKNIEKKTELIENLLREAQRSLSNTIHLSADHFTSKYKEASQSNDQRMKQFLRKVEHAAGRSSLTKQGSIAERQASSSPPPKNNFGGGLFGNIKKSVDNVEKKLFRGK